MKAPYHHFYAVGTPRHPAFKGQQIWVRALLHPTLPWEGLWVEVEYMKAYLEEHGVDISTVVWTNMGVPVEST